MYARIGSRCGPNSDEIPKQLPKSGTFEEDRGQFINTKNELVWRKGKWRKQMCKVSKKEEIDFYYYGPGYKDYECTELVVFEEDFKGIE